MQHALDSITAQTYDKTKIQVVISQSNAGVSVNLNNGIKQANGDVIRYLCDDDMLTENSVADTVNYFTNNPQIDFVHSNAYNFFEDGKVESHVPAIKQPTLEQLLHKYIIHGGTVTYRNICFKQRMFDESLWTGEEFDFNLWLLKNKYRLGYVDAFTYRYRRHVFQKSLGNKDEAYQKMRTAEKEKIKKRYL